MENDELLIIAIKYKLACEEENYKLMEYYKDLYNKKEEEIQ